MDYNINNDIEHSINYPLECDTDFDNNYNNNTYMDSNDIEILTNDPNYLLYKGYWLGYGKTFLIIDDYLYDQTKIFNCIDSNKMTYFVKTFVKEIFTSGIKFNLKMSAHFLSKPFLRIKIKTDDNIDCLIEKLKGIDIEIKINDCVIFNVNLLFIFLICEKFESPIQIFDVNYFLDNNSINDIKKMMFKITDNYCYVNQKYYFCNKEDKYLDIPLLFDFFSYNTPIPLVSLIDCIDISINLKNIPCSLYDQIFLMFEEIIYIKNKIKMIEWTNSFLQFSMINYLQKKHYIISKNDLLVVCPLIYNNNNNNNNSNINFIFVIVSNFNNLEYPEISKVEIVDNYYKRYTIELDNIWISQINNNCNNDNNNNFTNTIIYGIALDGVSDMKNWIKFQKKCVNSLEELLVDSYVIPGLNNIDNIIITNKSNNKNIFQYVDSITINISFSKLCNDDNYIDIIFATENLLRMNRYGVSLDNLPIKN
jgi:hypothetical protein